MVVSGRVRFKADDIWDAPEDAYTYEVIDGELCMSAAPAWGHQLAAGALFGMLWQHIHTRGLGHVVTAPVGVVLDPETAVQPDLVYVARERAGLISQRGVEGAPDLVVEVLSPTTRARDLGIKMRRYALAGIPHYWVVDPSARTLVAYELRDGVYAMTAVLEGSALFRPALFPDLEIPLDPLWA